MRAPSALLASLVFLGACRAPPEYAWVEGPDGVRWRELEVAGEPGGGFTALRAGESGISFRNDPDPAAIVRNQHLANGAGVALGDVNGDRLVDVFFTHTDGANALYLNRGGLRFQRVPESSGVAMPGLHPTGAVLVDTDGDGDLDLLVSAMGAPLALLENDGQGRFTDRSREAGFDLSRAGSSLALADIDGDADLDLYAANYRLWRAADVFPPEQRRQTPVLSDLPDGSVEVNDLYVDYYEVVHGPDGEVLTWEFGEADDLWLNDGEGHFERVAIDGARFSDAAGSPLPEEPRDWGLSVRFRDIDLDGDPDIYLANDFESPDRFWINQGDGTFRELGAPRLRKTSHASMSVAFGDVDGNGLLDVFVADMLPISTRRRKTQMPMLMERRPPFGDTTVVMQVNRNTLLLGQADGSYTETARWAGVDASGWTWGTELLDVDLDGDLDLVAATGHRWDPLDGDTGVRMRESSRPLAPGEDWREVINAFPELRLPNLAFRNLGNGRYELVEGGWGLDLGPDISHGLAAADLDGDGDLDLVFNRLADEAVVFRNDASAGRVALRLVGQPPNTGAVGARARVEFWGGFGPARVEAADEGASAGDAATNRTVSHELEVGAGGLYLSHSDAHLVFGTPGADSLEIVVRWPSGAGSRVRGLPGRLYEIREPPTASALDLATGSGLDERAAPVSDRGAAPSFEAASPIGASRTPPLFEDVSSRIGHVHHDDRFAASAQPLLPRSLSRLGPAVAWLDFDEDGDPDLAIGGGAGGRLVVAENQGGGFGRRLGASPTLEWDVSGIVPELGGGFLAGAANWEARTPEAARAVAPVYRVVTGSGGELALQPHLTSDGASTGPLASADIDGDGELDLFVGGRAYQSAYPIPPRSRVFMRRGGELVFDTAVSGPVADAGLVSGATFTDIDSDGDPDLVLALDWGSPRVFVNESGSLVDRSASLGLASHESWWNGVTAGDLDSDGLMDLVLTSWGANTALRASPTKPVLAHWGDFDRGGSLDVILSQHDDRVGDQVPLLSYPEIRRALPYVRLRTAPNFNSYADATLAEVLGPARQVARVERITTLEHTVFLNRGDRFEAMALPPAAQLAPAHGVVVAELNGDGFEDLALAQNFFPDRTGAERLDAGRGLVLLGDGAGGFTPLTVLESGVALNGDQRGLAAADFDSDGRTDLAVGQNAGPVVVLRGSLARPGLRVRVEGGASNPLGIGTTIWVEYADSRGPSREIRAGSGFWSTDGAVQVMGLRAPAVAIVARWPGGELQRVALEPGQREVSIRR